MSTCAISMTAADTHRLRAASCALRAPGQRVVRATQKGDARAGFTLIEMMITLVVFLLLAGTVFELMTTMLQSTSMLQDNQERDDKTTALYDYIEKKLTTLPSRSTIVSYARGDGEGLVQNGIIFGNTNLATAIDAKSQPNGLYLLRVVSMATSAGGQESQDARQSLTQAVTIDDPTLSWTTLVKDVKTLTWKFQDSTLVQWDETWTAANTPNLVELDLQGGGDIQATTMDFWVPKINPVTVHIQSNSSTGGGGGGGNNNHPKPPNRTTPGGQ